MKTFQLGCVLAALIGAPALAADSPPDDAVQKQLQKNRDRQQQAAEWLNQSRARIAEEKAPLLQKIRAAEDRILRAQTEARRIEIDLEHGTDTRRKLVKDIDDLARTATYLNTLAHDALRATGDGLAPGQAEILSERIDSGIDALDKAAPGNRAGAAVDGAELLLTLTHQALGGYSATGRSLFANDNQVYAGTFAFVGPETFFRADTGQPFGSVRFRQGNAIPMTHAIAGWKATDVAALFVNGSGLVPVDASGGKALRLAETKGSFWSHVQKGGFVALAIMAAGVAALIMIIQKTSDLLAMGVEPSVKTKALLKAVSNGDWAAAEHGAKALRGCTAQLFAAGLEHRDDGKKPLEEILESVLMEQRLRFERRLPLLAVIATASPLMGLLGTVVGMIRTFALITVFGTGNAGKLSSGISEVLVATELGLVVAIPTLVAHGFLAHRIHKNLSTLERFALDLGTALDIAKTRKDVVRRPAQIVA